MQWAPHPILCLYRSPETPWCKFFDELLIQEGYLCFDSFELDRIESLEKILEGRALLVVGAGRLHAREIELIQKFIRGGGKAILLRPIAELVKSLGIRIEEQPGGFYGIGNCYSVAPRGYLELCGHPWALHHAGAWIQCHALTSLWKIGGARTIAQYGSQNGVPSSYAAIIEQECGDGHIAIFWFDPGTSLVLMRQGDPRLASTGQCADADADGMHKSTGLFHGHLDFHLRMIPQADLLADVIVGIIRGMTDAALPIPRLWHLPKDAPAMTLLDGDSDGFRWDYYERLVGPCIEAGVPFTLNVHPDDFGKFDPNTAEQIFRKGNDLELHYWAGSPLATVEDAARNIPEQHRAFRQLSGGRASVGSRGHSFVWPGYTEMAELLATEGFRLDTSFVAFRGYQCGYVNGSGRVARFMTPEGRFLDISQQATVLMDDVAFTSKTLLPPMTPDQAYEQAMKFYEDSVRTYHGVINTSLHPGQFHLDGRAAIRAAVLEATRQHRLPALTVRDWVQFQEARRRADVRFAGRHWSVKTTVPIKGLTCHFPAKSGSLRQGLIWEASTRDFQAAESWSLGEPAGSHGTNSTISGGP